MKADRLQDVKRLFLKKKKVTNTELCQTFGISIETVRRDLNILEKEGFLRKIYGGAQLVEQIDSRAPVERWDARIDKNELVKRSIAGMAASMIPEGSTVFLDAGTSIFEVVPFLIKKSNLTILTNSLRVASELGMCEHMMVYCIGGLIKPDNLTCSGFFASELLSYFYHIDYALISCDGLIPEKGTTEYSIELSMLKKNVLDKADHIIVVADHTKFGISGSCLCCPAERIDTLVTDELAPAASLVALREKGVDVAIAATPQAPDILPFTL